MILWTCSSHALSSTGNFYAALLPSDKQWDLFMSPQLISELICNAVINTVTIHWSTVAILHNTVKLPAATVASWIALLLTHCLGTSGRKGLWKHLGFIASHSISSLGSKLSEQCCSSLNTHTHTPHKIGICLGKYQIALVHKHKLIEVTLQQGTSLHCKNGRVFIYCYTI